MSEKTKKILSLPVLIQAILLLGFAVLLLPVLVAFITATFTHFHFTFIKIWSYLWKL
ncbi:MAG: hypothetical protein ACRCXN_12905 [Bacteroidales bacterium]